MFNGDTRILEVADLCFDEPELEYILFTNDGVGDNLPTHDAYDGLIKLLILADQIMHNVNVFLPPCFFFSFLFFVLNMNYLMNV